MLRRVPSRHLPRRGLDTVPAVRIALLHLLVERVLPELRQDRRKKSTRLLPALERTMLHGVPEHLRTHALQAVRRVRVALRDLRESDQELPHMH